MGKVFKYGDNVDTDAIIAARYLNTTDPKELAANCMRDIDEDFASMVAPGDIVVAGENFGCGSSREHAPIALKASNVKCVLAKSFARIFYRNSFNIGFPILESQDLDRIDAGDEVDVDFNTGTITNRTKNETYSAQAIPPFMQEIIAADGLVGYVGKKLEK